MWRDRVYSVSGSRDRTLFVDALQPNNHQHHQQTPRLFHLQGTLRPKATGKTLNGDQLVDLLDRLNRTVSTDHSTSLSNIHSVNKIANGLYLGDKYAAKDRRFLQLNGITHVLNAAEGLDECQVDTSEDYYSRTGIRYMGIPGHDRPSWNISVYFYQAARFIDDAVKSGGRVLVHCVVGISRSATLVIAYLMIVKKMSAPDALQFVFRRRKVYPNVGFLHHLAHLDRRLENRQL